MKQDWRNEKEQFSPVSVLDYPFEDEEEIKSHLNSINPSLLEGNSPLYPSQQQKCHKNSNKFPHIINECCFFI